jgi:hypothetical protein
MPKTKWIREVENRNYCCPFCGGKPIRVLRGLERQGQIGREHKVRIIYIECYHKDRLNKPERFNFPNKFKILELERFPRDIQSASEFEKERKKFMERD